MKKYTKYLLIAVTLMFMGIKSAYAADIECTFKFQMGEVKCSVSAGDTEPSCDGGNAALIDNKLTTGNFQVDGKWKCPSAIYYKMQSGIGTSYYNMSITASNKAQKEASLINEKINKKSAGTSSRKNVSFCPYDDGNMHLEVNVKTKKMNATSKNCGNVVLNFTYDDFVKAKKNADGCPKLYSNKSAVTYGNYRAECSYSLTPIDKNSKEEDFSSHDLEKDANGNTVENATREVVKDKIGGCSELSETTKLLRKVYNLIKYLIPVLIIGLSLVDFLKVVLNGDDKAFKETWMRFVKRLVVGVVILILPAILSLIINVSGVLNTYGIDEDNIFCIFI